MWIYRELIATRNGAINYDTVKAINLMVLEFSESKPKEKKVLELWRVYHQCLHEKAEPNNAADIKRIDDKTNTALMNLLSQI